MVSEQNLPEAITTETLTWKEKKYILVRFFNHIVW